MTIRFLVNFVLLAIPIGVTLGILFGLQLHRDSTGQAPLFKPEPSAIPKPKNGVTKSQLCQKSFGFTPDTKGQKFVFNPNQWNWNVGDPGSLCMNVTSFNNGTYDTPFTSPEFMVTWQYPPNPSTDPVHGYPNVEVDATVFPTVVTSISKIDVQVEWAYGIGNQTTVGATSAEWTSSNLAANVAIDMFIDSDKTKSQNPTDATFELMVWFAAIGAGTDPLGQAAGVKATKTLNGTTFNLFIGQNDLKQNVLTWVAASPATTFSEDLTPLLTEVLNIPASAVPQGVLMPAKTDYIGYFSFGSETSSSDTAVTFYVPELSVDIEANA